MLLDSYENSKMPRKQLFDYVPCQVMDKYGDLCGSEKISDLLGLDKAALDFSSVRKDMMRVKKDTAWAAL